MNLQGVPPHTLVTVVCHNTRLWYECDITPLTWSHITTETPTSLVPESHLLESAHKVKITSRFNTEIDSQFNLISTLWGATHDANDQLLKKKTEQAGNNLPTSDSAETQTDPSSGRRVVTSAPGSRPMWLHCVDITYVCIPLRPDKNTSFFIFFFWKHPVASDIHSPVSPADDKTDGGRESSMVKYAQQLQLRPASLSTQDLP